MHHHLLADCIFHSLFPVLTIIVAEFAALVRVDLKSHASEPIFTSRGNDETIPTLKKGPCSSTCSSKIIVLWFVLEGLHQ